MTVGIVKIRSTVTCSNMNSFNVFVLGKVEVLWKVGPKNQNNKALYFQTGFDIKV